jgi:hypothetical protein
MAKSMSGQSSLFSLATSEGSGNATSSPASEGGATRFAWQDGRTIGSVGRSQRPVSNSRARLAGDRLRLIYGRHSDASLLQAALVSSLVNRCSTLAIGLITSALTWKPWIMPSGRRFCRLWPSVRTISALRFTLRATPTGTANQACASMQKWPGCRDVTVTPEQWCRRMGYPPAWLNCSPSAMPSSRKSRKSSSKRISTHGVRADG